METLGHVLKSTRERKRISLSQAAAKTRIKLQHLEMMERDDFSQMPAPAYARGFIRMYADFLGLESAPLVEEYNTRHQPGVRSKSAPPPRRVPEPPAATPNESAAPTAPAAPRVPYSARYAHVLTLALNALSPANLKRAGLALTVLLVIGLMAMGVTRCSRRVEQARAQSTGAFVLPKGVPAVVQEPPDPYLPLPETSRGSR